MTKIFGQSMSEAHCLFVLVMVWFEINCIFRGSGLRQSKAGAQQLRLPNSLSTFEDGKALNFCFFCLGKPRRVSPSTQKVVEGVLCTLPSDV
ncbi:hypothetical protein CEXT_453171 [Caerostris extrusa]|uniref:Secreted protein n=1 Tax=Caerostris extrusa TaxID=172846 RepID=A0AAV4SIQ6_CAEEX|nr:hypothetical protein CEXT_453171 [Caerostris extrusa]